MQVSVVSEDKHEAELQLDSVTIAEILRVYVHEQGVEFAAWRREHPSKPVLFKIKSAGSVSKVVGDAVAAISKELQHLRSGCKK